MLAAYRRHKEAAEQVAGTVAAIQLFRLQARPRTAEGGAIKERRRATPAMPRRVRPQGLKRKRPSAAPVGEQAGGGPGDAIGASAVELPPCERFGQAKVHELPNREVAMQVVFSSPAPAEGLHDLRPVGPWPLPGTVPARNGRLPWLWACSSCGRSAGDSSRAKELARKPCGGAAWQLAEANHSLELVNGGWRCSRCLLRVRPQHTAQTERQACPVGEFTSGEGRWLQGEAGLRELFGRLRAFRHFCEPAEVDEEPPQQRCRVGQATPAAKHAGAGGPGAGAAPRCGAAGAIAPGAGQGSSQQFPEARVASGVNPLAEAEGATARRALKLSSAAASGASGPCVQQGSCILSPDCGGDNHYGNSQSCGISVLGHVRASTDSGYDKLTINGEVLSRSAGSQGVTPAPSANTALLPGGLSMDVSGPPLFARLQPYTGHVVAFVGRSLWCLNCFEVPRSAHRSWKHGRCGGVRPPTAMPPALRDYLVRQPAACSGLQASVRARWAELAGDLRLQ